MAEPAAADDAPHSPLDLTHQSRVSVGRRTLGHFLQDECTDLAAALTYYAVLALFPAAIALLSLLGLFGQGEHSVHTIVDILNRVGARSIGQQLQKPLLSLSNASASAGFAFVIGLATALWSASGYVGSFGRAMNRIYGVREGRPFWKLRPLMLLVTLVAVVLVAAVLLGLVVTGPAAQAVGDAIGLGSTVVTVWGIAKWPVMLAAVIVTVALLYYATPNVKQPRFRMLSVGAVFAIVVWVLASLAFGFYVANFSSYNHTYGSLAGAVVLLLWLWITNLALLFGAELDVELERGRELQAGLPAERGVQLPHRDTRKIEKAQEKELEEVERSRKLRESRGETATVGE